MKILHCTQNGRVMTVMKWLRMVNRVIQKRQQLLYSKMARQSQVTVLCTQNMRRVHMLMRRAII